MTDIYAFLAEHGIPFERVDHPPVFTCEQAERLVPPLPGAETKNLLVRDRRGRRHFLVVVGYDKTVDLKALGDALGVSKLGMASPERLGRVLGIEPGSVSLLAVVNDAEGLVEVLLDEAVWRADALKCHPLVNPDNPEARANDRPPSEEEITACLPYLETQIETIKPEVIMTLGAPSGRTLLGTTMGAASAAAVLWRKRRRVIGTAGLVIGRSPWLW